MANKGEGKAGRGRAGKRWDRNNRLGIRLPELGYYMIVTDTKETEKNYFYGLRDSIPAELKNRLVIKVEKAKTKELVDRACEFANSDSQYRSVWIVFDRDQVKDFDELIYRADENGIGAGWSNPCFEIWLYAYLGEMPAIRESYTCCDSFARKYQIVTGQKYSKNDAAIYQKLCRFGDESRAIEIAKIYYRKCLDDGKIRPSEMWPASRVQELVEEIRSKVKNQM